MEQDNKLVALFFTPGKSACRNKKHSFGALESLFSTWGIKMTPPTPAKPYSTHPGSAVVGPQ